MIAIKKAVDEIKFSIPMEILQQVFVKPSRHWRDTPASLDDSIINTVIKPQVMVDMDLVGGTEVMIPLWIVPQKLVDLYMTIYNIPKDLTQGRSITSVLSVSYVTSSMFSAVPGYQVFDPCSVSAVLQAGQAAFDAMNTIPAVSSANVSLIGDNVVLVQDAAPPIGHGFLKAIIANDSNLGNIQLRSIPVFTELCELAVKAYIYNNLVVKMDRGAIYAGHELGSFMAQVNKYEDARTMYKDYLKTKWTRVAFMNDSNRFKNHITNFVGPF
jgi:hypothetical protein